MTQHPIRKFLGLALLYIVIIFGIFSIQFRNQSVISQNFGILRLTLSENKKEQSFVDSFQVAANGIYIFSDKNDRIEVTHSDGKKQPIVFINWNKLSDYGFELLFDNNVKLICEASGKDHKSFNLYATLPAGITALSVPFSYSGMYTITDLKDNRAILSAKDIQKIVTAPSVTSNRIAFFPKNLTASYSDYNPVEAFTFAILPAQSDAQNLTHQNLIKQFNNSIVSQFSNNINNLDEASVVAYIAEMGKQGRYIEAINNIPADFKNDSRRTYLTAPTLNNLVAMNKSLVMNNANITYIMNQTFSKFSFDIFEIDQLYAFLQRQKKEQSTKLLNSAVTSTEKMSLMQAIGLLETYCGLKQNNSPLATLLQPIIDTTLKTIERHCTLRDDSLFLHEHSQPVSLVNVSKAAAALFTYSNISHNPIYKTAANLLLNSHLKINPNVDFTTLSSMYLQLNHDNSFIPHELILNPSGYPQIWAWTIAQNVTCSVDADKTITLVTSFPSGCSHYMILNGIEPFQEIEIYGLQFRTDPRFESYNSSGYVYDAASKTLFLKQRHKGTRETVKLFYKTQEQQRAVESEIKKESTVESDSAIFQAEPTDFEAQKNQGSTEN